MVLAILAGAAGSLLPSALRDAVVGFALDPVADTFMNALNTFIGFMVFLSMVTGICSIGKLSDLGRMGKRVIGRMLRNNFVYTGLCVLLMFPLFRFGSGEAAAGSSQAREVLELLLSVIPSNPVTPFQEGRMLQVIFMACLTGIGLLILEEQAGIIRSILDQANLLVSRIIQQICRFLPLFIFSSLLSMIWTNGIGSFLRLWKPLAPGEGATVICGSVLLKQFMRTWGRTALERDR